jgi:alkylated DNA repair dioxygenase AlkB
VLQGTLFSAGDEVRVRPIAAGRERTMLGDDAWVDVRREWLGGADGLFDRLLRVVPWRTERRTMYDRVVDVPRMQCFYDDGAELPDPDLDLLRRTLNDAYERELGEPLRTVGLCLYRSGGDSVAWHGDTIGRGSSEDTMVAILSLGSSRRFLMRPRGGGPSERYVLGPGDLIVMGGSCQRTWEHAVPKTSRSVGPRISVQFRPVGVR